MQTLAFSNHAERRMRQRGIRKGDIELLLSYGTQLGDDSVLLLDADAKREIERRKCEIQLLERLRGCKAWLTVIR